MNELIGPYRLVDTIGRGGMGIVYRAIDTRDAREVALKTVFSRTAEHVASIRLEFGTLARLSHPGVVRVLEHGVRDGMPWYAMDLLEGRTLRDLSRGAAPGEPSLDLLHALTLVRRVCEPLAFLHGEGVVHGDLKASNVFLQDDERPVLVDFGLVQRFGGAGMRETLEQVDAPSGGTYGYMSPEQLTEGVVDPRSDIYTLGCVLYELVVGCLPFRAGTSAQLMLQHVQRAPEPPSARRDGIPPELDALILAMLRKRPADRIGYATDVASAIERIAPETASGDEPDAPRPRDYLYRPDVAGRDETVRTVERALRDPDRRLVLLRGPSGVGKTRLATELARRARFRGVWTSSGACQPLSGARHGLGGAPLHGLRGVLRDIGDYCRAAGARETARILGPRAAVLALYEPSLADLVDAGATAPARLPTTGASRRRLTSWLAQTLSEFAPPKGLLVLVDDVQWADEVTLGFLRAVARRQIVADGVHIVCTCRGGATAERELLGNPAVLDVEVGPLDDEAVSALANEMLGRDDPPPPLVSQLLRRARGNPLHVSEYLHAAVARGALHRREGGGWSLRGDGAAGELPATVEELIAARIGTQSQATRALLETLATIGRAARPDLLVAASESDEREVFALAGELIARDLIEDTSDGGELRFRHGAVQETIYRAIDPPRRRELHERVARALEATPDAELHSLAEHWDLAGRPRRAAPPYLRAAVRAQRRAASRRASRLFERGFELERAGGAQTIRGEERIEVELAHGAALYGTGKLDEAYEVLREALRRLGVRLPRRRAGWVGHTARELLRHVGTAPPEPDPERAELALRGLELLSSILLARADTLGQIGAALTSGNLAARSGRGPSAALGHSKMGLLSGLGGLEKLSDRYFARARDAVGDGPLPPRVHVNHNLVSLARGRWELLSGDLEPAVRACRAAGDLQAEVQLRLFDVGGKLVRGRVADCLEALEAALELADHHGYALERTHLLGNRAAAWILAGDARRARESLEAQGETIGEGGDPVARSLHLVLAAALSLLEAPEDARADADAALRALSEVPGGSPGYLVHHMFLPATYLGLAERGDPTASGHARRLARRLSRQALTQPAARPYAMLYRGTADRLDGRPRAARRRLEQAATSARALGLDWVEAAAWHELAQLAPTLGPGRGRAARRLAELGARVPPFHLRGDDAPSTDASSAAPTR